MDTTPICVESQVDWLTASAYGRDRTAYFALLAATMAVRERQHGDDEHSFRLNGYEGWRVGRVRYGERENAGLMQLSGELAHDWFDDVVSHADHVTRIDVAVTVDTGIEDPALGRAAYDSACNLRLENPRLALPSIIQDHDGGCTAYVGRRTSDWFLRIYDKHAECIATHDDVGAGQYERCWRYELEAKGIAATKLSRSLRSCLNRGDYIRAFLARYLRDHGIEPRFREEGQVAKLSALRRRSDRISRLRWLGISVAPAVRWLLETGDRTEVLEVLGLAEPMAVAQNTQG